MLLMWLLCGLTVKSQQNTTTTKLTSSVSKPVTKPTTPATTTPDDAENTCNKEAQSVKTPLLLLAIVPPVINVITLLLLLLLIFRVRAIRSANDEVFQSAMLLTRTALRVTIPRRAVEAIQKVIGDPRAALKSRLNKAAFEKAKKN